MVSFPERNTETPAERNLCNMGVWWGMARGSRTAPGQGQGDAMLGQTRSWQLKPAGRGVRMEFEALETPGKGWMGDSWLATFGSESK